MKVKNLGELLITLKPYLRKYLEDYGTKFTTTHFQCPNRKEHQNEDEKVACNFYPDSEHWKCFACQKSGDIFQACHFLEGRPTRGHEFITNNVLYLADKYNINYELAEESKEEKQYQLVQKFLSNLVENANTHLVDCIKKKTNQKVIAYLKKRKWIHAITSYKFGYLEKTKKLAAYFDDMEEKYKIQKLIKLSVDSIVGRLIYPIHNAYGLLVGISTRTLDEKIKEKKYQHHPIRSGGKPINMLFNLDKARNFSKVYLVEGASSVFTFAENKIDNVVSILGSNFAEKHYEWLLKNGTKELVFCFDGDTPGTAALMRAILTIQNKSDIKVFVKKLDNDKDPDDIIRKKGADYFLNLKEISAFRYQVDNYVTTEEKEYKESLFAMILSQDDALIRERMLNLLVKETKLLKTTIIEEIKKYEVRNDLTKGISHAEYLEENYILEQDVDKFDEFRWRTGELIGLKTGFHYLDTYLDGLQIGLHMIGGRWNVGKSIYCLCLALRLLENKDNYVLYFSIDDPNIYKTIPRMVANLSGVNINLLLKPRFGIEQNENLTEEEKTDMTYNIETAINTLKGYSSRFSLRDAKHGQSLDFIFRKIKLCKQRALDMGNKNLIVFIDFLHMIKVKSQADNDKLIQVAESLKEFSTIYEAPIVTTVMGTKSGLAVKNITDDSIKGAVELQYEADTIMLLESDFEDNHGKMYFYDDEGKARAIISNHVSKNKVSEFKGKIFYRFFGELMRFEECEEEEQIKFRKTRGGI